MWILELLELEIKIGKSEILINCLKWNENKEFLKSEVLKNRLKMEF